jgi:hypothetical protein
MQLNYNGPSLYGVMAFAETENAGPRFVWAANLDQRREIEALLWRSHGELVGDFGGWLAALPMPPVTAVLLGGSVRLNAKIAKDAARSLREVCGLPALRDRGPVCQIVDGQVVVYPSTAEAARRNGVTRARIFRLLGALCVTRHGLWI